MSWPEKRKSETRQRIIETAAKEFRARGMADVGVAEIMRLAGLTHGGFYAHFESKDELIAETVGQTSAESALVLSGSQKNDAEDPLLAASKRYLSTRHLAHPELGCTLAALGPELSRGDKRIRKKLGEGIRGRLQALYDLVAARWSPEKRRQRAAGALACMVGGMIIARGLKDTEAEEFLGDCRRFLEDALVEHSDTV